MGLLATGVRAWFVNDYRLGQAEQQMQAIRADMVKMEWQLIRIEERIMPQAEKEAHHPPRPLVPYAEPVKQPPRN